MKSVKRRGLSRDKWQNQSTNQRDRTASLAQHRPGFDPGHPIWLVHRARPEVTPGMQSQARSTIRCGPKQSRLGQVLKGRGEWERGFQMFFPPSGKRVVELEGAEGPVSLEIPDKEGEGGSLRRRGAWISSKRLFGTCEMGLVAHLCLISPRKVP